MAEARRKPASDIVGAGRDAQVAIQRHHLFDAWLVTTDRVYTVVADNIASALTREDAKRQRAIRAADLASRKAVIHGLFANLAYARASDLARGLSRPTAMAVSLRSGSRKLTRYDRRGFASLRNVIAVLSKAGANPPVIVETSHRLGRASLVAASPSLSEMFAKFRPRPQCFQRVRGGEVIRLSRTTRDREDNTRTVEPIHYPDPEAGGPLEPVRLRAEMEAINRHLRQPTYEFLPDGGSPVLIADRELCRQFKLPAGEETPRFDLCGRLFGGWWQTLSRERRHSIRIDGEPMADLDFSNMFLRLAYLQMGTTPPEGDLYAGFAGLSEPQWRAGIKRVVNAMLCREGRLQRLPRDTRGMLPAELSAADIRASILGAHPLLAPMFEAGKGLGLMFAESQTLVTALLWLIEAGITALPMHDGLMVAQTKAGIAAALMGDAAEAVTGHRLPISLKTIQE